MNHIELEIVTHPGKSDIVIALLSDLGFDMFQETDEGVKAYISADRFLPEFLRSELLQPGKEIVRSLRVNEIPHQNWNLEWEKHFDPVLIGSECIIRAPFHTLDTSSYPYQVIIHPGMAFGTGHHETTALIAEELLGMEMTGKSVLDCGCGTGILAIIAAMKGAKTVWAMDIDENCYRATLQNAALNHVNIIVNKGAVPVLDNRRFDLILANINRNVLLDEMGEYAVRLVPGGLLLISGFLHTDEEILKAKAEETGLVTEHLKTRGHWMMMTLRMKQRPVHQMQNSK